MNDGFGVSQGTGPVLQCLMGARAAASLAQDLGMILTLPEAARAAYWDLLQGCIGPALDDRVVTRLKRFAKEHEIEPQALLPSAKACRFVLRAAARHNTPREAFASDMRLLSPEGDALVEAMVGFYDKAFPGLRKEVVFRSIAEHGSLVSDIHWRLETLLESDHAVALDVPLTSLTFSVQEGPDTKRVTMQLLPEQIRQLQGICNKILPPG